jgi:hypothetical protein
MIDPSVTAPSMTDDRAAYVRNLIAVRCPEIEPDDFALITQPATPTTEPDLPPEIGEQILDVLAEMGDRLDRIVGVNGEDDAD